MIQPYHFIRSSSGNVYSFTSIGRTVIEKLVTFYEEDLNLYNLALLDLDEKGDPLPLTHVSNNGDILKVLTTVEAILNDFLTLHAEAIVFITGTDDRRTHIYHSRLVKKLKEGDKYIIVGVRADNTCEPLNPNADYEGFFIFRK